MSVYVHEQPVTGPGRFFGRQILVRSLVQGLTRDRGFLVLGGPRTGRTSTLAQVAALMRESWRRMPEALKTVPVRFDATAAAAGGRRTFLPALWRAITEAVRQPQVAGGGGVVEIPTLEVGRSDAPWEAFRAACKELWDRLSGTPGWCQWCLLVDGGDVLASYEMEEAQEPLASLVRSDEAWAPRGAAIAAGRLLRENVWDHRSPLNFMRPLLLGALRDSEAESLVRVGFPDAEQERIQGLLRMTGKHPYLLQRALAELEGSGSELMLEDIAYAIEPESDALMEAIWHQFDLDRGVTYRGAYAAPEHALMQYVLDAGGEVDLRSAERDLGIRPLKEYAEFLEFAGVVERTLKGDVTTYRPQFDTWSFWYRQRVSR